LQKLVIRSALSGAAAGIINGLFGAGGGMILVPLLIGWCKLNDREAFASSLAVIYPLCVISAVVYGIKGTMNFTAALPYLAGGLIGGFLGGKLFSKMKPMLLHRVFGLLILWGGVRSLWP